MNSKVMVTGGAGFVGARLVQRLLAEGLEVYVYDAAPKDKAHRLSPVISHSCLHYTEGDLRDIEALKRWYVKDAGCLYHLASVVGVRYYMSDPLALIDIVVGGTRALLELASAHNTRVLFTSTSEVYGKNMNTPWSETDDRVLGPASVDRWSYSTAKAVCEHMLFAMHRAKGLEFSTVRFFNVYGPGQAPIFVASQSIYRVLRNEAPDLYDGGEQTRCFTYVDDAVEAVIRASRSEKAIGEAINIGSNTESTMNELLKEIIDASGSKLTPRPFSTKERYGDVYEDIPRRVPAVAKARELLDWEATTPLSKGIALTMEWAKANEWWLE